MFNINVVNVVTLLSYLMTYNSGGQPGLLSYGHVLSLLVCEMPFARVPLPFPLPLPLPHHHMINIYGKIIHFNLFSYARYGLEGATDMLQINKVTHSDSQPKNENDAKTTCFFLYGLQSCVYERKDILLLVFCEILDYPFFKASYGIVFLMDLFPLI